ncbi:hypothetical protein K466DRAFT_601437 [Polyporus arcularius HHB13444]|uniref:Protein prenylyltransferase n=1 Tax=Polyporus arcularius HHB13444 TaxID=1314778 RepID=A0A5C3P879_9APHY|nr:hypothetical protein K466DRAFT_601437 [Polyporus arcularius HHB13444]
MSGSTGSGLSPKLAKLLNEPPISVELLPGDGSEWLANASSEHAPFLFVDRNLGVPQKAAYKAYLEAVPHFQSARQRLLESSQPPSKHDIADAAASSSVLLLVNPAHQSALNTRKRLVEFSVLDPTHELRFTDALLTLREGAKQSILWQHRRWLLRRIHRSTVPESLSISPSHGDGVDSLYNLVLDAETFRAEFAVVEKACEVYPRNYHAWAHRFLCAQALISLLPGNDDSSPPPGPLMEVLREELARMRLWIERHISDYSAMQYYRQLEGLLPRESPLRTLCTKDTFNKHAMELVRAYPTYESLWLYLRSSLPFVPCTPDALTPTKEGGATTLAGPFLSSGAKNDRPARRHAVWFIAWMSWTSKKIQLDGASMRKIADIAETNTPLTVAELVACLRDHGE